MAINIAPGYTLDEWRAWLQQYTDWPLTWAQDVRGEAAIAFQISALGTKVIIDRRGHVVHRSAGVAGYDALKAALREAL